MGNVAAMLPAGFQSDPDLSRAVGSGVDSVSAGIQSAVQTSGPAEVAGWLENISSFLPPIGDEPSRIGGFADVGVTSSPDVYLNRAQESGDVNGFSDLVLMDKVAMKLADSSFDYQRNLEGFSDIFKDIEFAAPNLADVPSPLDDASARRRVDIDESLTLLDEASAVRRRDDFEETQATESPVLPGEAIAHKVIPPDAQAIATLSLIDGESQAFAYREVSAFSSESVADAEIFERLQFFQKTLDEIVELNQGK